MFSFPRCPCIQVPLFEFLKVCRLIESFDDGAKVILIYECCDGGTLLDELADPDADQNTEELCSCGLSDRGFKPVRSGCGLGSAWL